MSAATASPHVAGVLHALEGYRLDLLLAIEAGPQTVSELVEATGFPRICIVRHMRPLRLAGLVRSVGYPARYELVRDAFPPVAAFFARLAEPQVEGDPE
jgi:predicted transcriptional regulator